MNLMLLSSVQRIFTAQTTGLAIFTLLALGTFTAGVHVLSWQVGLLGLIMALGIPAIVGLACRANRGCGCWRGRSPVVALAPGAPQPRLIPCPPSPVNHNVSLVNK